MTAHISAYGRLVADPDRRETRKGNPWATGRLAVTLPLPWGAEDGDKPPVLFLSVTAFNEQPVESLCRHRKGENLSVMGRLELRTWTGSDGKRREDWTCIAESVIGPRSGRPGGKRQGKPSGARDGRKAGRRASAQDALAFDDTAGMPTPAAFDAGRPFSDDDIPF